MQLIEAGKTGADDDRVITRDGVAGIDEALRDRVNVLSVSGSHDRLTVGSRLYRNDGKEAVIIIVES